MKTQQQHATNSIGMLNQKTHQAIAGGSMSRITRITSFNRITCITRIRQSLVFLQLMLAGTVGAFSTVALSQTATIFEEPPTVDQLAEILFPPLTRSIVLDEEFSTTTAKKATAGIAGMLIQFEFGKTDIVPESLPFLDAVGQLLTEEAFLGESIIIEGHTDSIGTQADNQKLSERRALAIRRYLVSRFEIDTARLHPVGKGETLLHVPTDPTAAVNRRVQFRSLDRSQ